MGQPARDTDPRSGWLGMAAFGAIMLFLAGLFQVLAGLVGLFNDQYWLVRSPDLLVGVDYTTWGWFHLLLGLLALCVGAGVYVGRTWAVVAGVGLALLSAVVNLAFMAASPTWSTVVIVLDVLVIFALVGHGTQLRLVRHRDLPRSEPDAGESA